MRKIPPFYMKFSEPFRRQREDGSWTGEMRTIGYRWWAVPISPFIRAWYSWRCDQAFRAAERRATANGRTAGRSS